MALVVPDEGERRINDLLLRRDNDGAPAWKLGLYKVAWVPYRDSVLADVTPCDFAGYAPIDLDPATWTTAITVNGAALSYYGVGFQSFEPSSGSQNAYGYYVWDDTTGTLLWAEPFDATALAAVGQPVLVQPVFQGRSAVEPIHP